MERAAPGWLPRGLHANGYVADHQGLGYFQITADGGGKAGATVTLTAYVAGNEPGLPHLPGGISGRRVPAAPVNGHPAYWTFKPTPGAELTAIAYKRHQPPHAQRKARRAPRLSNPPHSPEPLPPT